MTPVTELLNLTAGLLLRLGLPLVFTAGVIWLLRRLDARWQSDAEQARPVVAVEPCWEFRHCSPARAAACPAYLDPTQPCWQHFRDSHGNLNQPCLACELFRRAAVPAHAAGGTRVLTSGSLAKPK